MRADLETERLSALIAGFPGKRILVVGDLMLDVFVWGRVSRISPEAPVPVVDVTSESSYPGGAANVARNLRGFQAGAAIMGLTGNDPPARQLLYLLGLARIDTSGVQQSSDLPTTLKTRIIARNQQVVRVDRERKSTLTSTQMKAALDHLERQVEELDGIVVADYGKGFVTQPLADALCAFARAHGKILTVDPHPHTSIAWRGVTAIKPNRAEAFLAAGLPPAEPVFPVLADRSLLEAGRRLLEIWRTQCLLITLGEHGMLLLEEGAAPYHTPARAKDVFDVSGAGDTAIAVFTLGLAAGGTPVEAAELANLASSIVVGKLGTATLSAGELEAALSAD